MFDCSVCQQKFDQYALEIHFAFKLTNFRNEDSNKCDIFLSQHIENDSNHKEKMYRCNFCTNCFDTKKQLQIHTNTFHKAFKCDYCGILFTHAGHLRRHIKLFKRVAKISNVNLVEIRKIIYLSKLY